MAGSTRKYTRPAALLAGSALAGIIGLAVFAPEYGSTQRGADLEGADLASSRGDAVQRVRPAPAPANAGPATSAQDAERGTQEEAVPASTASSSDVQSNSPRLPAAVGRKLTEVIELLNADRFAEARARLDELMTAEAMANMSPFERSRLYQLSFNLNMQSQDYEAASADIQAALESGGLNPQEVSQISYQRAQLFVQMEDYGKAADSLELWISSAEVPEQKPAHYLLAASYYYQDRFDDARDVMETLFTLPGENQEAWYAMMATLYLQNEDYAKAKPVLETMVSAYGRDRYRTQLNAVDAELETGRGETP